ncbi:unnamed protein product [Brachionus calyciflorus]|uniref:Uncharacterized protein n=1 Tax=Brachionus calyciflorus TaxID=104777 RepID=A0A813WD81_9BILA|nr:unnamed protein product [Brachionus calyciflorus]
MKFLQFTILIAVFSFGITLNPCQIPNQWQAKMYERDDKKSFRFRGDYSYDSLNRNTRKIGLEKYYNSQDYVDVLRIFNDKIEYKYSYVTKTCVKSLINYDWKDFGIPENASYYADLYVGSSDFQDSNLLTSSWGAQITSPQGEKYDYLGIYSVNNCLPISLFLDNEYSNYQVQLFNITAGIPNPETFVPRIECI